MHIVIFYEGYPAAELIPELIHCYLELGSPAEVINEINRMIEQEQLDDSQKSEVKYLSGIEMEKRGHNEQALMLYKSAGETDPENEEITDKIKFLMSGLSTGSKYDYLLNQNIMNTEQLKEALAQSKKVKKSVEFILIDQFNIDKEDLGKTLSFQVHIQHGILAEPCRRHQVLLQGAHRSREGGQVRLRARAHHHSRLILPDTHRAASE